MKNLINWMCLISIMVLILQVMIHINLDVFKYTIKKNRKRKVVKSRSVTVGKTRFDAYGYCYEEKIAK
ncbi:Uncharacterised protein [[Clostridium] sordellii]|uniref:hypothetical protein n=1 Tax=Paraclostridium sordellii TaxID=1505 RepID=UPI0005E390E6|nr:hypothetical protein [Paeniclostridium sordellii]MDU1455738.1 hypothetical protein [Paeniclostridium sordellii]CEO12170.1 Uncharacterised protein [[Clostridium] sordellii] [Paeniclostridium sordellii]